MKNKKERRTEQNCKDSNRKNLVRNRLLSRLIEKYRDWCCKKNYSTYSAFNLLRSGLLNCVWPQKRFWGYTPFSVVSIGGTNPGTLFLGQRVDTSSHYLGCPQRDETVFGLKAIWFLNREISKRRNQTWENKTAALTMLSDGTSEDDHTLHTYLHYNQSVPRFFTLHTLAPLTQPQSRYFLINSLK